MSQATERFIDQLVAAFPGLQAVFEEHLSDNFGEVLPHVFFGDLTRYVIARFRFTQSGTDPQVAEAQREVQAILDDLEDAFASGELEIRELITVSFLENLPRPCENDAGIRDWVGPNMSEQLLVVNGQ